MGPIGRNPYFLLFVEWEAKNSKAKEKAAWRGKEGLVVVYLIQSDGRQVVCENNGDYNGLLLIAQRKSDRLPAWLHTT